MVSLSETWTHPSPIMGAMGPLNLLVTLLSFLSLILTIIKCLYVVTSHVVSSEPQYPSQSLIWHCRLCLSWVWVSGSSFESLEWDSLSQYEGGLLKYLYICSLLYLRAPKKRCVGCNPKSQTGLYIGICSVAVYDGKSPACLFYGLFFDLEKEDLTNTISPWIGLTLACHWSIHWQTLGLLFILTIKLILGYTCELL